MKRRFSFAPVMFLLLAGTAFAQMAPGAASVGQVAIPVLTVVTKPAPFPPIATVGAAGQVPSVVKVVKIYNRQTLLDLQDPCCPLNTLKGLLPHGVQCFYPIPYLHSFFVKAESEDEIDQFAQVVKMLDSPVQQVALRALFISTNVPDAVKLSDILAVPGAADGKANALQEMIIGLVAAGKVRIISAPTVVVSDGARAVFNLGCGAVKLPSISMQVSIHPDGDTITLTTQLPQENAAFPGGVSLSLTARSGIATVLASGIPLPAANGGEPAQGMIIITPTRHN